MCNLHIQVSGFQGGKNLIKLHRALAQWGIYLYMRESSLAMQISGFT